MVSINGIAKYFLMIVLVMLGIFAVKWASKKFNIPVVSTVAEGV